MATEASPAGSGRASRCCTAGQQVEPFLARATGRETRLAGAARPARFETGRRPGPFLSWRPVGTPTTCTGNTPASGASLQRNKESGDEKRQGARVVRHAGRLCDWRGSESERRSSRHVRFHDFGRRHDRDWRDHGRAQRVRVRRLRDDRHDRGDADQQCDGRGSDHGDRCVDAGRAGDHVADLHGRHVHRNLEPWRYERNTHRSQTCGLNRSNRRNPRAMVLAGL